MLSDYQKVYDSVLDGPMETFEDTSEVVALLEAVSTQIMSDKYYDQLEEKDTAKISPPEPALRNLLFMLSVGLEKNGSGSHLRKQKDTSLKHCFAEDSGLWEEDPFRAHPS